MSRIQRRNLRDIGIGLLVCLGLAVAPVFAHTPAPAQDGASPHSEATSCFLRRNWDGGWKATKDSRTIYIKVSERVYRLDLAAPYSLLRSPWAVLGNRGPNGMICSGNDFDLWVSDRTGVEQWPVVKSLTRLTPAQAAALPKKLRP